MDAEKAVAERYQAIRDVMNELVTRRWAGAKALALGCDGVTAVAWATGLSRMQVRAGRERWPERGLKGNWCECGARALTGRRGKWPSPA